MNSLNSELVASRKTYAGLFMVTLSTLMYEILLTRIFSVTMWYHFAFVAVSVAMFGMTVGAIIVYLLPSYFTSERAKSQLAISALLFAVSTIFSFLTHLSIPFVTHESITGLYAIALNYFIISIPFVFSGICVSLALTRFPNQVSRLYSFDLAGAAVGCIVLIYVLLITDGPTAVVVVAFGASAGSVLFALDEKSKRLKVIAASVSAFLLLFAFAHTVLVWKQKPYLRLMWVKGQLEGRPLYEKWNSFSRVRIWGNPDKPEKPFGWGLSSVYPGDRKVNQLQMTIDATAATFLTRFDGNLSSLDFLKYDVVNMVHYIRRDASVFVIGTGGGRDVLSALVFGQKSVLGVEINKEIIDAVNKRFGDFTGHLDRYPNVKIVNDEARSYVARSKEKFDIIQVSLIDTWAATAAGAFVLAENSLYTVEAWKTLLEHLTQDGVLTFSRWYMKRMPAEVYRLVSLAAQALGDAGINNPSRHIILVRCLRPAGRGVAPFGIGTILLSRSPFSESDINVIEQVASLMNFEVVYTPRYSIDQTISTLASGEDLYEFTKHYPLNITPSTDNAPFFFNMLRVKDVFKTRLWRDEYTFINLKGVAVLMALLMTVIFLTLLCVIVPVLLTTKKGTLKGSLPFFLFFACIGLGFMLVEISQMQRLIVFLGHPTYGLSVVLFALLLSSGLGSFTTQIIRDSDLHKSGLVRLIFLNFLLVAFGLFTPYATKVLQASTTFVRIFVSVAILFQLGLFMGMAFPMGMRLALKKSSELTPWLWGINGATSVLASVLAVVIALNSGISSAFWTGFFCYLVALVAFVWGRGIENAL